MKKIKIGDKVKVIQGADKGQIGKIKGVFNKKNKVVVTGVNKKFKHLKPDKRDKVGKILQFESPIDISNVMLAEIMRLGV
jgi:large subunit ribosomal protein L24